MRNLFNAVKEDMDLISKIAKRAVRVASIKGQFKYNYMTAMMDIEAAHCNGCPLDLERLLNSKDFDFAHDIFGIAAHINRTTGELEDCFVPRFAKGQS